MVILKKNTLKICLSVIMPVKDSTAFDAPIPSPGEGGLFKKKLGRGNLA